MTLKQQSPGIPFQVRRNIQQQKKYQTFKRSDFFHDMKTSKTSPTKIVNKSKLQDGKHRAFLRAKSTSITSQELKTAGT